MDRGITKVLFPECFPTLPVLLLLHRGSKSATRLGTVDARLIHPWTGYPSRPRTVPSSSS